MDGWTLSQTRKGPALCQLCVSGTVELFLAQNGSAFRIYRDPVGRTLSGPHRQNASIGKSVFRREGILLGSGIFTGTALAEVYRDLLQNGPYREMNQKVNL